MKGAEFEGKKAASVCIHVIQFPHPCGNYVGCQNSIHLGRMTYSGGNYLGLIYFNVMIKRLMIAEQYLCLI